MFIILNKYIVGKTYNQSNKKGQGIDQFTEWLNIQENNVNSGVGNAQSIAPAYYINRDLNIFNFNGEKIPAYLVIVNSLSNNKYSNIVTSDNYIYHWGDSKFDNKHNSAYDFKGNRIFKLIYELRSNGNTDLIPPILYFDKPQSGKLVFKGICILDELFLVNDFEDEGITVPNYLAKFKLTDDNAIEIGKLHERARAKSIDDLPESIPGGLKQEIKKLKGMDADSHIKPLKLNEYLKIIGGVMEERNELQENNLNGQDTPDIESVESTNINDSSENLSTELDDTIDSNENLSTELDGSADSDDNIENENISCWLLALDDLDNHFSTIDTNKEVSYQVSYASDLDNDINPQKNDFVIGYISNEFSPNLLKYVFKITDVLVNENESKSKKKSQNKNHINISFIKLFETCVGMRVDSILDIAPNTHNNIVSASEINRLISRVNYNEFNDLVKFMLESLASSIFNITNTQEIDIFDIEKHISEEELNKIEEDQKDLDNEIRNKIIYGAPGTGKSHSINSVLYGTKGMFKNDYLFERITFHPSYTYGQFVGTYKPSPIYSKDEDDKTTHWYGADKVKNDKLMNPHIDYTLVAGPFLNMLCKAINNPKYKFLLIIEEMNRANAAAVFGDVFQLLDRDDDDNSRYSIKFNSDITNFLINNISDDVDPNLFNKKTGFIKIPENLFIWATMNSADEGVSKIDSAFKRRWSFEYTDIAPESDENNPTKLDSLAIVMPFLSDSTNPESVYIKWNKFRTKLNDVIYKISPNLPEDKYIGPFFLKDKELLNSNIIKSKLLLYLKDDVLRHNSKELFTDSRFSDIFKKFEKENIFAHTSLSKDELLKLKIDKSDYNKYDNLKDFSDNGVK